MRPILARCFGAYQCIAATAKVYLAMSSSDLSLEQWCSQELSILLGEETPDDFVQYLLSIEDSSELTSYVRDLIGSGNAQTALFVEELERRRKGRDVPDGAIVYKKYEPTADAFGDVLQSVRPKQKQKNQHKKANSNKVDLAKLHQYSQVPGKPPVPKELPMQNGGSAAPSKVSPKRSKTKYVSLYSAEGEARSTIQLAGRHYCECQAQKHKLISNCIKCGRVVCAQEGSGPCLFCGELVCTKQESEYLASKTKASQKLRKKLMEVKDSHPEKVPDLHHQPSGPEDEDLNRAIAHKNRLIENDRNSMSRLVIDDQSDYFSTDSNHWLSTKDRKALQAKKEQLKEQKYGSRRNKKVTLDFAGRRVIEEGEGVNMYDINDETVQRIHYGKGKDESRVQGGALGDLFISGTQNGDRSHSKNMSSNFPASRGVRIQDRELLEMSDEGWCLSMHQPWASLLIEGIKKHEGRTWYSTHRGRLWIAAAAKKPTEEEVKSVEESHRCITGNENVEFPAQYPTGCLLGCVDMVDCLAQEQYREKVKDCYVISSFEGRLDSQIHKAAKKGLRSPKRK
ncbi:Activating signal cointegrator 1 [Holothuria leucospilota]|uniref:Activating signal cointegrator 1 n=1 Tax=Holothuria leucospilota TaxID=206669 RepID=A0A9Q1BMG5_HOLLE|nr:Activating signal cointegrator 1 [Holothuria leucospilota]